MSAHFTAQAWRAEVSTTAKLLLVYLADNCGPEGSMAPYQTKDLAEIIRRNTKTTLKALTELEENQCLVRQDERWLIPFMPPSRIILRAVPDAGEGGTTAKESPAETAAAKGEPDPGAATPDLPPAVDAGRFTTFCASIGAKPDAKLIEAWQALEAREAKFNRRVKHSDGKNQWAETAESIDDLMPAILLASEIYRDRESEGLPNNAASPLEFLERELWLVPLYQARLLTEKPEYTEAELDEKVMEMNRRGGGFACNLRMSGKNPDTGEIETETLAVYQKRVLAKWRQYEKLSDYMRE